MAIHPGTNTAAGGRFRPRASAVRFWATVAVASALASPAVAVCAGDLEGTWERRPPGTSEAFEPVEAFRLDSLSGRLEDCTRDVAYDARLIRDGPALTFLFRAVAVRLTPVSPGLYLSRPTIEIAAGVRWEYRVRLVAR